MHVRIRELLVPFLKSSPGRAQPLCALNFFVLSALSFSNVDRFFLFSFFSISLKIASIQQRIFNYTKSISLSIECWERMIFRSHLWQLTIFFYFFLPCRESIVIMRISKIEIPIFLFLFSICGKKT